MARKPAVAVSGTPGTGKSAFARELAGKLGATLIDLNVMIEGSGAYELDEDGTRVVGPEDLRKEFSQAVERTPGSFVVEGLLAHLLPEGKLTHIVVLRTRPKVLERRLRDRGYSGKKLQDNLEAEALSVILWEAVQTHGEDKVYEIDATDLDAPKAVKMFLDALDGKVSLKPGGVDWLEEYYGQRSRSA